MERNEQWATRRYVLVSREAQTIVPRHVGLHEDVRFPMGWTLVLAVAGSTPGAGDGTDCCDIGDTGFLQWGEPPRIVGSVPRTCGAHDVTPAPPVRRPSVALHSTSHRTAPGER
jgi:hypothetical protein